MRASGKALSGGPGKGGDPIERARKGYKNSWHRKDVDESFQVSFGKPLAAGARVSIIGGGIAGLMCGRELAMRGMHATVFDTGLHGPGGRMGTRTARDASIHKQWMDDRLRQAGPTWDHAAQFFTTTDPRFAAVVQRWLGDGAVREWGGPVGRLRGGNFTPDAPATPRYVAAAGMRQLAVHVAEEAESAAAAAGAGGSFTLSPGQWVSQLKFRKEAGGGKGAWEVADGKGMLEMADAVVIAHNGKCANRLTSPMGAPLVARQLMQLRLNAVWVAMVALPGLPPMKQYFEGAFVDGDRSLSWVANNSAKLELRGGRGVPEVSCWTLISTAAYGAANKVPQERVPPEVQDKVAGDLLAAFERNLGLPQGELGEPLFYRCQLWGAALPLNSPGVEFILDPVARVGVCGDWLLGAGIQSAAISGMSLAQRLVDLCGVPPQQASALGLGLQTPFQPLRTPDIGEFPTPAPKPPPQPAGRPAVEGGLRRPARPSPAVIARS